MSRSHAVASSLVYAIPAIMLVGAILRIVAAFTLSPHVDEGASLLAGHAIAERGLPILPSGTVYTQGTTLSYLIAPFVLFGLDDLADLNVLRLIVVTLSVVAIWLVWRWTRLVTESDRIALLAAGFVALDPLSVQWSAHLRMYGLMQALSFAIAIVWTRTLATGVTRRRSILLLALYWLAVFTHLGSAALIGIALFLSALWRHRMALTRQFGVLATLAGAAFGGVLLLLANRTLGSSSVGDRQQASSDGALSFVGDNLLSPFSIAWDEAPLNSMLRAENLSYFLPAVVVAVSMWFGARALLRSDRPLTRYGAVVGLCLYWVPMIGVFGFTRSPKERYLLNAHLMGYLFLAVAISAMWRSPGGRIVRTEVIPRAVPLILSILIVVTQVFGTGWRLTHPVVHPDHNAAMEYVARYQQPGEPIISALPAIAWLALDDAQREDLMFLAGEQNQDPSRRYTRYAGEEGLVDYWIGSHAITEVPEFAQILRENPDAWIIVDVDRLTEEWAYQGSFEELMLAETISVYRARGGVLVLRVAHSVTGPHDAWQVVLPALRD